MGNNAITCGAITATNFSTNGPNTSFLKADCSTDTRTYLTNGTAGTTYATITSLANYLSKTDAISTYATITSLANYLTTTVGATKT